MKLHLLRHGATLANEQRRYGGRTDQPLSPGGVAALQALKARGVYPPGAAFYTSGMLRARQTLAVLYGDVEAESIPELAECDFGTFEMGSYEELRYDPDYLAWIGDESGQVPCPGGESREQYRERVLRGFSRLLMSWQRKSRLPAVAIVHGGTIVHILSSLFPGERDFYGWQPLPGLGYTLCQDRDGLFTYQSIKGEDMP